MSKNYRLYIDESGTHNYNNSDAVKERYLCLNGVIISAEHNKDFIVPNWEELRSIFTEDTDFPAMFHLTDIMNKKGIFQKMRDPKICKAFDEKYLQILKDGEYIVCSVVLDKKKHLESYGSSAMHPYHYCLNVLLERYIKFLVQVSATGDVVAEARGKKEDNQLKSEFMHFYENGTAYLQTETIQKRLTSKKLKLNTKEARIAGLEIADMLALPMKFLTLYKYKKIEKLSDNFTVKVLEAVHPKIRRSPYNKGRTKGYGTKLI